MSTAEVLGALADPTRRQLVELLARRGEGTATTLAGEVTVTRQAVVQHLTVLKSAGVVDSRKLGREVRFGLRPVALTSTAAWMDQVARQWEQRLSAVKELVERDPGTLAP